MSDHPTDETHTPSDYDPDDEYVMDEEGLMGGIWHCGECGYPNAYYDVWELVTDAEVRRIRCKECENKRNMPVQWNTLITP